MKKTAEPKRSLLLRTLDRVEVVGNALPHPATIFALLAGVVVVVSAVGTWFDLMAVHPGTGEAIRARSLLTGEGIRWMFENIEHNFVKFPPLGLVLVAMIGIGIAEGSGLLTALIRALVLKAPSASSPRPSSQRACFRTSHRKPATSCSFPSAP
jgi:aminobenzoyl-glutamate transport protein